MEYSWFLVVIHKLLSRVAQQGRSLAQGGSWGPCSHRLTVEPWLLPELNSTANEMASSLLTPAHCGLTLASLIARTAPASTAPSPHNPALAQAICSGRAATSSWARGGVCFSPQKAKRMSASQSHPVLNHARPAKHALRLPKIN